VDTREYLIPIGSAVFDPIHRTIRAPDGRWEKLTALEAELLFLLAVQIGSRVARDELAKTWGHLGISPSNPYRKTVGRLRKPLSRIVPEAEIVCENQAYTLRIRS